MAAAEIRWNDEARTKILDDADRVLREAVLDLAGTRNDASVDDLFAEINSRMKGRFIDYEPGPDVRKYAEAIASGEFATVEDVGGDASADRDGTDARGNDTTSGAGNGSADLTSQNGNGVAANPGQGAFAPDSTESDEVVNDG